MKNHGGLRKRGTRVPRLIGARLCALLLAGCAVAAVFVAGRAAESSASSAAAEPAAMQRPRQRRPQRRPAQPRRPATDYSAFNHDREEHRRQCSTCHAIPLIEGTGAAPFPAAQAAKLEVTDFPDHPSCVECHRQQFFRGARPVICSSCHTVTGPRSEARFPFPKTAEPPDFDEGFSHKTHASPAIGMKVFRVLFNNIKTQDDACIYCHTVDKRDFTRPAATPPAAGARQGRAAAAASPSPPPGGTDPDFVPKVGMVMTTLAGHAKCFACHWQEGVKDRDHKPLANQCVGCHQKEGAAPKPALASSPSPVPSASAAAAGPSPRPTPASGQPRVIPAGLARVAPQHGPFWRQRIATRFVHEIPDHKKRENGSALTCISCHKPVTTASTLGELKVVESKSCGTAECHAATTGTRLPSSIFKEFRDPKGNLAASFSCTYCHVEPQSKGVPPCSHFEAVYTGVVYQGKAKEEQLKRKPDRIERDKKNFMERLVPARCQNELKEKFSRIDRDVEKLIEKEKQQAGK